MASTNNPNISEPTGPPPRSTTGCWTCRTRKVKCDESKPVCRNCIRLGHSCDYSIRIAIRDDTQRVVRQMRNVTLAGNSVWDPISPPPIERTFPIVTDDLPPFASLATDVDRQRKAECYLPGTYHVIFNVDSFQLCSRQRGCTDIQGELPISTSQAASLGKVSVGEANVTSYDPNIVILSQFEDLAMKKIFISEDSRPPISLPDQRTEFNTRVEEESPKESEIPLALCTSGGPISRHAQHFRDVVWKKLFPYEFTLPVPTESSSIAILEATAVSFPPLIYAMNAVTVLSLTRVDDTEPAEALASYQQAFSALQNMFKTPEYHTSDGVFLTFFLLLVYETAAANAKHSNLWSHHLSMLTQIWRVRQDIISGGKYQFVVWLIYEIDLCALFSGFGSGEFVCALMPDDTIPPPFLNLYPLGLDSTSAVYAEELDSLQIVWRLYCEVTMLGAQLALLAKKFRQYIIFDTYTVQQRERDIQLRKCRGFEIEESFRELGMTVLPPRPKRLFEQSWAMYQACIIYSYTSMWSAQQMDTSSGWDTEIVLALNEILQMANNIISAGRLDCRSLVFPLVMAGFASRNGMQKLTILELMRAIEQESIGRNTQATRKILEIIYERQNERFMHAGHSLDVDWIDIMAKQKFSVVCFGL